MPMFLNVIKFISIIIASIIIGKWFLTELKSAQKEQKPWYAPYISIPGIIIIIVILIPVFMKYFIN